MEEIKKLMQKRQEYLLYLKEEKKKALADIYRKREEKYRAKHKNDKGGTKQ